MKTRRTLQRGSLAAALAGGLALLLAAPVLADPPADSLELVVDPFTGDIRIVGNDEGPVLLIGYDISSSGGGLDPAGWFSFEDQSRPDWVELVDPPTAEQLAEGNFGPGEVVGSGGLPSLGSAFDPAGPRDLVFMFSVESEPEPRMGTVTYSVPEPGSACVAGMVGSYLLLRRRRSRRL